VKIADTFFSRLLGLLPYARLDGEEGLFFPKTNSIHTCFMRFPIDVIYLKEMRVLKINDSLPPFRFSACLKADAVLELKAGTSQKKALHPGDILTLK